MDATHAVTNMVTLAEVNENKVTPGLLGFVVFAVLAVGVWLLMKSMHRHMGRVDFVEKPVTASAAASKTTATTATSQARPATKQARSTAKADRSTVKADREADPKAPSDQ